MTDLAVPTHIGEEEMKKAEIVKKERRVAEKLKDLRIQRGMSQNALADKSGIDRKTVNRIENNHFSPNLNTLFRLCETLSVKPAEVLK